MDKSVVSTQLTNSVKTILTYTCMLLLTNSVKTILTYTCMLLLTASTVQQAANCKS